MNILGKRAGPRPIGVATLAAATTVTVARTFLSVLTPVCVSTDKYVTVSADCQS